MVGKNDATRLMRCVGSGGNVAAPLLALRFFDDSIGKLLSVMAFFGTQ
jgi:hypothetical protein